MTKGRSEAVALSKTYEVPYPPTVRGEALACYGGVSLSADAVSRLRAFPADRLVEPTDSLAERTGAAKVVKIGRGIAEVSYPPTVQPATEAESRTAIVSLPQTPMPAASWQASGGLSAYSGFPSDAQIAVSTTHVIVTARSVLAIYNKAGELLLPPISSSSLFQPLNLQQFGIDYYFDERAIFDPYRRRFWIATLAVSTTQPNQTTKFAVAVSLTENPLDGWYLYWWNGVANPVFQAGDAADYPTLGIDSRCFYQTNAVNNQRSFRYWRVVFFPTDQMASGVPGSSLSGWQYWDLSNPDGSPANRIQAVVHHDSSPRAYFVNRYGNNQSIVWGVTDALQPTQQLTRVAVSLNSQFVAPIDAPQLGSSKPIAMTNLGTDILKAVYRSGQLYLTTMDARDWDNRGQAITSIRLVRLNVANYPNIPTNPASGFIDRTFGARNVVDDPPDTFFFYGWPAVEVNRYGDMLTVYARSGATIDPEVRCSAYYATEPDIRPSRLLKRGESAYAVTYAGYDPPVWPWADTAGACVDPADDTAIWVAQQYASTRTPTTSDNGNFEVWVGRFALNTVLVPDCSGFSLEEARISLEAVGLGVGRITVLRPEPGSGRLGPLAVVDQYPEAGAEVGRGATVDLQLQKERFPLPRIEP